MTYAAGTESKKIGARVSVCVCSRECVCARVCVCACVRVRVFKSACTWVCNSKWFSARLILSLNVTTKPDRVRETHFSFWKEKPKNFGCSVNLHQREIETKKRNLSWIWKSWTGSRRKSFAGMVFRKFQLLAVLAAGLLSDSGGQKLTGSGKDYLQQTEQGPWFTGSCKFPVPSFQVPRWAYLD